MEDVHGWTNAALVLWKSELKGLIYQRSWFVFDNFVDFVTRSEAWLNISTVRDAWSGTALYFLSHTVTFTVDLPLLLSISSSQTSFQKGGFCKEQAGSETMSSLRATLYTLQRKALECRLYFFFSELTFSPFSLEDTFVHPSADGKWQERSRVESSSTWCAVERLKKHDGERRCMTTTPTHIEWWMMHVRRCNVSCLPAECWHTHTLKQNVGCCSNLSIVGFSLQCLTSYM